MGKKLSREEMIDRFKAVHGDKYDYSKFVYTNASTNALIICPEHGEFSQQSRMHASGQGCPVCAHKARQDTCEERYGIRQPMNTREAHEKSKQTWLDKYGVDNPMKDKSIHAKAIKTSLEKYGYDNPMKSERVQEKHRANCMAKYGVPYTSMVKEFREKQKRTNLERYGCENCFGNRDVIRKSRNTKLQKSNFNKSGLEDVVYEELVKIFGKEDIVRGYSDERYDFLCDFYIKSRDLFLEVNIYWTHGGHWFDEKDLQDLEKLEVWKSKKSDHYGKAVSTWTDLDVRKRLTAMDHSLNYVTFWDKSLEDFHGWVDAGCPDSKDWIQEYEWMNHV